MIAFDNGIINNIDMIIIDINKDILKNIDMIKV